MCFINKLSGRQMPGSVFPLEMQNVHVLETQSRGHNTGWQGMETVSCQLGLTSCLCVDFDSVLENLGLTTVHIKNINSWSRKDLKSHNISISQWASAVRFGKGVLSGTRGLKQPPTSCFPCLRLLTREEVRVRPEWLFQPPHLDARAGLEQK